MREFLSALSEVYPECVKVRGYNLAFRAKTDNVSREALMEIGTSAVETYNAIMSPWYERCVHKDSGLIEEDIKFIHDLDLHVKWPDMDADTRDTIWDYIIQLNQCCGGPAPIHPGMPPEMVKVLDGMPHGIKMGIYSTSSRYTKMINDGEMNFEDLDVTELAADLQRYITDEDLAQMNTGGVNMDALLNGILSSGTTDLIPPQLMSSLKQLLPNK